MKRIIVFTAALLFISVTSSMAHGVSVDVSTDYPVVITKSYYSANQPLGQGLIEVYSPANTENPYYSGNTDRAGYFVFIPDQSGEWKIVVDDQQGHRKEVIISIEDTFFNGEKQEETVIKESMEEHTHAHTHEGEQKENRNLYGIILGLSIIFGITGIVYGIRAKQQLNKQN